MSADPVSTADANSDGEADNEADEHAGAIVLPHVLAGSVAQLLAGHVVDTNADADSDANADADAGTRRLDESRSRDPRVVRFGRDARIRELDLASLPQLTFGN